MYERELEDSKKLIEELAREKSRLEIDSEKANAEAQDALAKYVKILFQLNLIHRFIFLLDLRVNNGISVLLKVV